MYNSSGTMYKIGKVFNIIGLVSCAILALVGLICLIVGTSFIDGSSEPEAEIVLASVCAIYISIGLCYLAFYIITLVFLNKAREELSGVRTGKNMQIVMIVFGAICNIFYMLGGIFGLIAINNAQKTQKVEEIKEDNIYNQ